MTHGVNVAIAGISPAIWHIQIVSVVCRSAGVHPGLGADEQWLGWKGIFSTLTDYPGPEAMLQEWEQGVSCGQGMRTRPFRDLEQEEFESPVQPDSSWRKGEDCKQRINKLKNVIAYAYIQVADKKADSLLHAMQQLTSQAEQQVTAQQVRLSSIALPCSCLCLRHDAAQQHMHYSGIADVQLVKCRIGCLNDLMICREI